MRRFFSVLAILCATLFCAADNLLFGNGRSDYSIVLCPDASDAEQKAAKELKRYLKEISGADLPIVSQPTEKCIQIGWSEATAEPKPQNDEESFRYFTRAGHLYIYGGSNLGTMYGVYAFLENELGVRWYTSTFTKVPKIATKQLADIDVRESPCIQSRLVLYKDALNSASWRAHNRLKEYPYWGMHTSFTLVPPDEYFESHPEFFSLINGKRIKEGQLCLSNKRMRTVLVNSLLAVIAKNPNYWCYDVSQMDNEDYCHCKKCQKLAKRYGGQSGAMIWFVNKVAAAVAKRYPEARIGTFAYMYTRHAPTGIRPAANVVVRLCDVECCFSHPLASTSCSVNSAFMKDLHDWSRLTDRIYLWDYVTDFVEYQTPYPNFRTLGPNIRTFADNGVVGLLEEASYDAPWTEFSELRQWILAKLMWNPRQDVDSLAREFCLDYYGKAATDVYEYWKSVQDLVNKDTHIHFNSRARDMWYSEEFIEKSITSLEKAVGRCANDSTHTIRAKRVLAQVYFVYVCRHYAKSLVNGRYKALKKILEEDPTIVRESNFDLDRYLISSGYT